MKIEHVQMIDSSDWDDEVQKTYGRIYCLQQQDGCRERGTINITVPELAYDFKNDTVPEVVNDPDMGVSFKAWLARNPKQPLADDDNSYSLDLWWNRNFYPNLQMVANDLHAKGLLPAGTYSIKIDW
jgi:hypothetical protein